jgi:hypothetical protein
MLSGIGGLVLGIIIVVGGIFLSPAFSDDAETDTDVCPENIGHLDDSSGYTLYVFATCGDDLTIFPAAAGRYDLQGTVEQLGDMMNTGTIEVIGDRINIEMGDQPLDEWIRSLNIIT